MWLHGIFTITIIGSESAPDGHTVPLADILSFATGTDQIPPSGLQPTPSLHFYDGVLPLASTCSNQLTVSTVHTSYYDFTRAMVEGILGCGGEFGQP